MAEAEVKETLIDETAAPNVANMREKYEQMATTTGNNKRDQSSKRNINNQKDKRNRRCERSPSCCSVIASWFRTSRLGGIPFAVFYGLLLYYYVAFVILSASSFSSEGTARSKDRGNLTMGNSSIFIEEEEGSCPDPFELPESLASLTQDLLDLKDWTTELVSDDDISDLNMAKWNDRLVKWKDGYQSNSYLQGWVNHFIPDIDIPNLNVAKWKELARGLYQAGNDTSSSPSNSSSSSSSSSSSPIWPVHMRHYIGGSLGLVLAVGLGTSSVFYRHVRCGMMLVVPGIFAGRGRALLLTVAAGFLLNGPIRSINANVEEVVNSLSCMYSEMTKLACNFQSQFMNVLSQVADMLVEIQEITKRQREETAKMAEKLVGDALEKAKKMERRLSELHDKIEKLVSIVKGPAKVLGKVCDFGKGVKSVFTKVGKAIGGFFKKLFGRRKKRSSDGCGILPDIPTRGGDDESIKDQMSALEDWAKNLKSNVNFADVTLDEFADVIQTQSVSELRRRIVNILKDVFHFVQETSEHLKKAFYVLSIVLIIYDATSYLRQYSSDDSFDNMFADDNLRRLWQQEPFLDKLTPLRHWELNERYQVSLSIVLSKDEITRIFLQAIPTLIFVAVAVCAVIADSALASLLALLQEYGDFAISFKGMEQNFDLGALLGEVQDGKRSLASLSLEGFDLTTEPCLPRPVYTSHASLYILATILVVSLVSCVFDAYASRWRAQICNAFYVGRARTRGEYLYRRIRTGRGNRRFQLKLVVIRELDRRENLWRFSCCWARTIDKLKGGCSDCCCLSFAQACPGCNWVLKKEEEVEVEFREAGRVISTRICLDCHKDH